MVKWAVTRCETVMPCNKGSVIFTSIPMYTEIYGALVSHTGFSSSEILTKIQHPLNYFGVESVQLFLMSTENKHQNRKNQEICPLSYSVHLNLLNFSSLAEFKDFTKLTARDSLRGVMSDFTLEMLSNFSCGCCGICGCNC